MAAMNKDTKKLQPQMMMKMISSSDLKKHNRADDLWISINGKVYDVTEWVPVHPGGELPLLHMAGQDVTDAFMAFHPGHAWQYLDKFMIGHLQDYQISEISKDYRKLLSDLKVAGLFRIPVKIYVAILLAMAAMFAASVVGVVCFQGFWVPVFCGILMGLVWTQAGWIGHDSGHSGLLDMPVFDRVIQLLVGNCLTGISIGWWKRNHNAHHISCNSLEFDPDLQYVPLFAVSSRFFGSLYSYFYGRRMNFDSIARFLVSYQHLTFYPVMAFARVNLFAQSFLLLLSSKIRLRTRILELLCLILFWVWFPLLVFCLPTWLERAAFVLVSFMVTGIQHVQFCLNHFSSSVYVGRPDSTTWFQSQTKGTLDISCSSWMDWFHGGLQFQVEHHLFPTLPRHNLRKISPFVKSLCCKHSLPYTAVSFWEANLMTLRTLRTTALEAQELTNPVPKNLLWEALNTHG